LLFTYPLLEKRLVCDNHDFEHETCKLLLFYLTKAQQVLGPSGQIGEREYDGSVYANILLTCEALQETASVSL
jgi:hypothetical protein